MEITIFTNATLLNQDLIDFCKGKKIRFKISLYGHNSKLHDSVTRKKGSFDKTIENLIKLKDSSIPFSIALVIMKENQRFINEIENFIYKMDFKYDGYDIVRKVYGGCQSDHLVTDHSLLEKKYLTSPSFIASKSFFDNAIVNNTCWGKKLAITCNGKIIPCIFERDLVLGDLQSDTLKEIINSDKYKTMLHINKDKIDTCRDCEYRYVCKDCRPLGKSKDGNLYAKFSRCTYNPFFGAWEDISSER